MAALLVHWVGARRGRSAKQGDRIWEFVFFGIDTPDNAGKFCAIMSVDGVAAPTTAADDEAGFDDGGVVMTAVIGGDGMYSVDAAAAEAAEAELAGYLAM